VKLRGIPGDSYRVGACTVCGSRVQLHRKPGTAECPSCGAWYNNLTGQPATDALLAELGHTHTHTQRKDNVMRFKIILAFDEEYPLPPDTAWPALAQAISTEIRTDPAAYLNLAVPPINGEPGKRQRGRVHVTVKPA